MTNKNVIISELFDLYEFHFIEMIQIQKSIEVLTGKMWSEVSPGLRTQSADKFIANCDELIKDLSHRTDYPEQVAPKLEKPTRTHTFPARPCEICETMFHPFRKNQSGYSEKCQKIISNRKQRERQRQAIALLKLEKKPLKPVQQAPLPTFEPDPDENLLIPPGRVVSDRPVAQAEVKNAIERPESPEDKVEDMGVYPEFPHKSTGDKLREKLDEISKKYPAPMPRPEIEGHV